MNRLALQVQQALGRDPYAGDLYVFRGKRVLTQIAEHPAWRLNELLPWNWKEAHVCQAAAA